MQQSLFRRILKPTLITLGILVAAFIAFVVWGLNLNRTSPTPHLLVSAAADGIRDLGLKEVDCYQVGITSFSWASNGYYRCAESSQTAQHFFSAWETVRLARGHFTEQAKIITPPPSYTRNPDSYRYTFRNDIYLNVHYFDRSRVRYEFQTAFERAAPTNFILFEVHHN